jgi:hypothetical protein
LKRFRILAILASLFVGGLQALGRSAQEPVPAPSSRVTHQLTADDVRKLEESLVTNPDNLNAREQLLRYYFRTGLRSSTAELEQKREQQILWLIEHHPETGLAGSPEAQITLGGRSGSTEGYQRCKQLWLEQVDKHPNNQRILTNAAQFLLFFDEKIAQELLERSLALDPADERTSSTLALVYDSERRWATSSEQKASLAQKAFSIREQALEKTTGKERFYMLGHLATAAFKAGETAKAEEYALELLQDAATFKNDWNYGNAILDGNIVLGRIALQHHDVASAKQYLLSAGETPGSPQLDSFGPDMTLAKELLETGEREVVVSYLRSCAKFWKTGQRQLQSWIAKVKDGGIPDFEARLED